MHIHIYVSENKIIGSDNGLVQNRRQAIIRTNEFGMTRIVLLLYCTEIYSYHVDSSLSKSTFF